MPKLSLIQLWLFGTCATATFFVVSALSAQDTVVLQIDESKPSQIRTGKIVDFNAKILTIKIGDNQRRFPTVQVRQVDTKYTASQLRGDEQFRNKNYSEAIKFLRMALEQEPRDWVKRQISATLIEALRENGNWISSADLFAKLVANESQVRHFHTIPVAWLPQNPNAGRTSAAEKWIDDSDEVLALIGCSYLMAATKRTEALEKLQKLRQSKDPRIAQIATMQVWRSRMLTAPATELDAWKKKLQKFPESIRVGGYLVIASALANNPKLSQSSRTRAATEMMQIPILFSRQHRLAASALQAAAKLIKPSNPLASKKVLRELASKFPNTEFGKAAAAQLQLIK